MIDFKSRLQSLVPELISIRRHLHSYPELSFEEFETSKFIQSQLTKHHIEFSTGWVKTGIVAIIKGINPDKKCIALRADIDALPIVEKNNVSYCSKNIGIMHACGHDVHSTCVLGAAILLNECKNSFEGTVKIIFQPGEEKLPGGAKLMIENGVLENPKVDCIIGQHVFPEMEVGNVGYKSGDYMASTDELHVKVIGKGGHAALKGTYLNPILVASELILEIQQLFENPNSIPTVIAFGKIEGLGATNIIPESVSIEGTFRTMNEQWRQEAHELIFTKAKEIEIRTNSKINFEIRKGYPSLRNDDELTEFCKRTSIEVFGENNVHELDIRMTAEDFSFYSQKIPACFYRLGTGNKSKRITSSVHTPTFDIDEDAISIGVLNLTEITYKLLR